MDFFSKHFDNNLIKKKKVLKRKKKKLFFWIFLNTRKFLEKEVFYGFKKKKTKKCLKFEKTSFYKGF